MLRVIPFPPPPRSMVQGDRMNGHHPLHTQPHQAPPATVQKSTQQLATPAIVSRVYRTCTNLFLTRRLPEALATLQPIIADSVSPNVKCSRALRTKVWSLYFAILDAAAKMGAEEGKKVWGTMEWRKIVARVRSGAVWEEAIAAYGGEGRIDVDVVNALVTLMLSYSLDQSLTQKKIEAYLSAAPNTIGTDDDPKGISQRVKLVELYILHVLPRVGDWEYAREFTHMSPDLDDEQKDIFQATLDQLQKDSEDAEIYFQECERQRQEERAYERDLAEEKRIISSPPSVADSRSGSTTTVKRSPTTARPGVKKSPKVKTQRKAVSAPANSSTAVEKVTNGNRAVAKTKANSKNLFATTTALLNRLQAQMNTAQGRFALLRTVIMLAMVVWMTSKRKVRERVRRLLMLAWIKTTRTVGMGMKVTYI